MQDITLVPSNSLITGSAEQGRQLAIKMARLVIKATQPDAAVREQLRKAYANDAQMLLLIGQVVATEFATIAAANGYWLKANPEKSPNEATVVTYGDRIVG